MNRLSLSAAFAVCASAAMANIQFVNTNIGRGLDYTFNGNDRSAFAGRLNFKDLNTNQTFQTFCADLSVSISGGQSWNTSTLLMSSMGANYAAAGNVASNAWYLPTTNEQGAALQAAIWEAVYDHTGNGGGTSPDFSNGIFRVRNEGATFLNLAASYYSLVNTVHPSRYANYFQPQPASSGQGQLTVVPEPATMAVLGLGLAAVARRRKARNN